MAVVSLCAFGFQPDSQLETFAAFSHWGWGKNQEIASFTFAGAWLNFGPTEPAPTQGKSVPGGCGGVTGGGATTGGGAGGGSWEKSIPPSGTGRGTNSRDWITSRESGPLRASRNTRDGWSSLIAAPGHTTPCVRRSEYPGNRPRPARRGRAGGGGLALGGG